MRIHQILSMGDIPWSGESVMRDVVSMRKVHLTEDRSARERRTSMKFYRKGRAAVPVGLLLNRRKKTCSSQGHATWRDTPDPPGSSPYTVTLWGC